MDNIELLSPVGDFECLKAAVQNGANAVYLGASTFSARANAKNFDLEELKNAIEYATLRNVKVHLALNTLIKNEEWNNALELAIIAYNYGVSAIIVQDIGLAKSLIKMFPDLPIHASTQMSIHNLEGAKIAKEIGFARVVLSRELSIDEIRFIHSNCDIELETFIHGALCICYSGQCLMSSAIGARSGNRGKCAQVCRLPYTLINSESKTLDKGYLLSPKDLCGLEYIPSLIEAGNTSFKIEGRMKSPEYVAIVTKIYRKYIDLALSNNEYVIDPEDKKSLIQVFNRGGFSNGHLEKTANRDLIFKEKPGNMGVYIGNISGYNANKGYIKVNLNNKVCLGDTISVERESSKYYVSELMENKNNILEATDGMLVKIGRVKGNIKPGDKVFKLEDKQLFANAKTSYSKGENIQTDLAYTIKIQKDKPIFITVHLGNGKSFEIESSIIPSVAVNAPITKERIITQFSKTGSTPFQFIKSNIILDDNLYVNIADLNELRRMCITKVEEIILSSKKKNFTTQVPCLYQKNKEIVKQKKISLLLNELDINTNYALLDNIDAIYIPLKYFADLKYSNILKNLSLTHSMYIYMPNIIKANYKNLFANNIDNALDKYDIKGFVLSNISNFDFLKPYKGKYTFIGNYTLNIFNNNSIKVLNELGIDKQTISCELSKSKIEDICNTCPIPTELIVYGNIPVMTSGYCFLGQTNKCYPDCPAYCKQNSKYYLKDKMGFDFRVVPDNIQTVTTIYNSKIASIDFTDFNLDYVRIDILNENIFEINNIIKTVKQCNRLSGKDYTNGNLYREV